MMETAFSLGTNTGDRLALISAARDRLAEQANTRLTGQSPLYETEPVEVHAEHKDLLFLNAVIIVESKRPPEEWLKIGSDIEYAMGRRRSADQNAPRPIDIDILFAGNSYINKKDLVVPHPRWAEREFVVKPLADIRPNLVLPGMTRTVREQLRQIQGSADVRLFAKRW